MSTDISTKQHSIKWQSIDMSLELCTQYPVSSLDKTAATYNRFNEVVST